MYKISQSILYKTTVRMGSYPHGIHMRCVHESSQYRPHFSYPPPKNSQVAFVFGGFLPESAVLAVKRSVIGTTSRLTMLAAIKTMKPEMEKENLRNYSTFCKNE